MCCGTLVGWNGVHSVHIKTTDSPSLPIYSKIPSAVMKFVEKSINSGKALSTTAEAGSAVATSTGGKADAGAGTGKGLKKSHLKKTKEVLGGDGAPVEIAAAPVLAGAARKSQKGEESIAETKKAEASKGKRGREKEGALAATKVPKKLKNAVTGDSEPQQIEGGNEGIEVEVQTESFLSPANGGGVSEAGSGATKGKKGNKAGKKGKAGVDVVASATECEVSVDVIEGSEQGPAATKKKATKKSRGGHEGQSEASPSGGSAEAVSGAPSDATENPTGEATKVKKLGKKPKRAL